MRLKTRLVATAVIFALAISMFGMAVTESAIKEGLKLGVVNLNKVFEEYQKRKDLEKDFKDLKVQSEEALKAKQNEAMSLREEVQLLDMGSEARKKKEEELEKKAGMFQLEQEMLSRNLTRKEKEYYEELYKDISEETALVGQKEGFDLILKKEDLDTKSADLLELRLKIGIGTVLYYSNAVDITDMVIKNLNGKYSRKGGGK